MKVEQLDDLPVLGAQFEKSNLSDLLDQYFPAHGHWLGISMGKLTVGWLLYILSEGDHRLSFVQEWAESRLEVLAAILDEPQLRGLDFSDDRLGRLLDHFQQEEVWYEFEKALGKKLLQVYSLGSTLDDNAQVSVVRTDSFNVPQFREPDQLFRYGYSKQRRADQPFCKVMMAALDAGVVPLAVEVLKGSGPDADHYLPVIERAQSILGSQGDLYVGDAQLSSLSNRLAIHQSGNYYLAPLGKKQCSEQELYQYLNQLELPAEELPTLFAADNTKRKTAHYHQIIIKVVDTVSGVAWEERRILVYAPDYAQGLVQSFDNRLAEAEQAIQNLVISKRGRRNPKTLKDLYTRIGGLVKKYGVEGCFEINCWESIEKKMVSSAKKKSKALDEKRRLHLQLKRNLEQIDQHRQRLGWQVYASNAPEEKIVTADLVKIYRDEYRIEHLFDYILNRDVGLLPVYLKKEGRIRGLIHLLSLAMRFSMLIQHQVRNRLAEQKQVIKGVYPGNKGRATSKPTTPMLLRVFKGMAMVYLKIEENKLIQMTPLTKNQINILELLGFPDVYQRTFEKLQTNFSLRET